MNTHTPPKVFPLPGDRPKLPLRLREAFGLQMGALDLQGRAEQDEAVVDGEPDAGVEWVGASGALSRRPRR